MLNKTIWLLWLQGWDGAPWLIKQVAESWEVNNPGWTVEYVTFKNVPTYVDDIPYIYDPTKEIKPQHKADIIRLSLLKNYGGVWADATMLCMQPLDTWVDEAVEPAGLWMYHGHGGGMDGRNGPAIWLIASEKRSCLISKWKAECDKYWGERGAADSYFWLDGLFKRLFQSDEQFRNMWSLAPHLYCELKGQAHSLARWNRVNTSSRNIKRILRERPPYALKLRWKPRGGELCRNSNGYFAIQMSKRRFVYKHVMTPKGSVWFHIKYYFLSIRHSLAHKSSWLMVSAIRKIRARPTS